MLQVSADGGRPHRRMHSTTLDDPTLQLAYPHPRTYAYTYRFSIDGGHRGRTATSTATARLPALLRHHAAPAADVYEVVDVVRRRARSFSDPGDFGEPKSPGRARRTRGSGRDSPLAEAFRPHEQWPTFDDGTGGELVDVGACHEPIVPLTARSTSVTRHRQLVHKLDWPLFGSRVRMRREWGARTGVDEG